MTMLANRTETGVLTLADYEARIHLYKEQIGTGYIGIGRTLNEAKDAKVVPHGEWAAWVERTTGLTIRQAQRCMQAATEIRDGSALAKLEMSKALMLLQSGLEEETQEAIAREAAEDGATVKALKEEIQRVKYSAAAERAEAGQAIKKLKLQIVDESSATAEIRAQLKQARTERDQIAGQIKARDEAWRGRLEEEVGNAYKRGSDEGRLAAQKEADAEARQEFQRKLDFANSKVRDREERLQAMQADLRRAREEAGSQWDKGFAARAQEIAEKDEQIRKLEEKTREIAELQAELDAAEKREEKRNAEMAALRKEKTRSGLDAARGIGVSSPGALDLSAAVRDFIGRAGVLPQMGNLLSGMSGKDRETILANVETIGKWVTDSLAALGVVKADARIQ